MPVLIAEIFMAFQNEFIYFSVTNVQEITDQFILYKLCLISPFKVASWRINRTT